MIKLLKVALAIVLFVSISASANNDYYRVHLNSCVLKVPKRYQQHISFLKPKSIRFWYLEGGDREETHSDKIKNFLTNHEITINISIDTSRNAKIERLKQKYNFLSKKSSGGIELYRFKYNPYPAKTNQEKILYKDIEKYNSNNIFYIHGEDFNIFVLETEEYIDDIYKMVDNCSKEILLKKGEAIETGA